MQAFAPIKRRDALALGMAVLAAGVAMPRPTRAQAKFPDRPIKLVVPFVPGGVNDAVARLLVERIKAPLGNVYIENQGGAGGAVGAQAVAHALPDGYTLLLGGAGALVLNPIGMTKPLYDPIKDFEPIAMLAVPALTLVVNPEVPVHTLKELIAYAKANPGKLVYGSAGTGSTFPGNSKGNRAGTVLPLFNSQRMCSRSAGAKSPAKARKRSWGHSLFSKWS